jgi:hypothetical protein
MYIRNSPVGATYCKTTPFRSAIRLLSTKRPLLTQLFIDRLDVAETHTIATAVLIVCIKKCKFPLWFSENLKHYIRKRTTSVGVLRNVGLITITTNFPQIVGLLTQPYSVVNSTYLKVPIITSSQIRCIFGNMCLLSGKTTEIPLNLRLMETV